MPSVRVEVPIGMMQETARSRFVSSQSLINCFYERLQSAGGAVYGHFGLTQWGSAGSGPIRGMHAFGEDELVVVSGSELYSVDTSGNETLVGAVAGYDPVIMADNGEHVAIVSDSTSYLYDGSTVTAINDPDFLTAYSVDFLRQVLIFTKLNSGVYFTSELADAVDYDALDVATAEAKPDYLQRVFVSGNEALLFGTRSVEGVYFSGKADGAPLSPTQTSLDVGLAGRDAVCAIDNTVAWLSNLLDLRTLREQSPIAIGDPSIIAMIQGWTNPGTARAFSFAQGGHEWMALRHDEGCVLWDATTRMWSVRQSHNMDTWRVNSCERFANLNIMGDATDGTLWKLDASSYAEGSNPLVRTIVSQTLGPGGLPFTLEKVELEIETGVGLATGQGSDPKIWMQLSRDSGESYGARLERSMGLMGKRNTRVVWQGPFGDFPPHGGVIKFGVSDPVRLAATKCYVEYTSNRP